MKHISHCEFSWSWSLDPREDNSSNMRLWEIFISQLTSSFLLVPCRCRQKQRNLPTGGEVDEGMVLCQICFIPTCVSTVSHGNAQMRKYSEAGGGQEMHDVKEVVIQPPWLHLTLVIVIVICDDDDDDAHIRWCWRKYIHNIRLTSKSKWDAKPDQACWVFF